MSNDYAAWVEPLAARDRESRAEAVRLARSLSRDDLARATGDDGWCVRDELAHMASADPDFVGVLGAVIRGETPDLSVFGDIDAKNVRGLDARRERSVEEIASELEESGRAIDALFRQLNPEHEAHQPEGMPFPLGGLVNGYSQHGPYHVGQIRAAIGSQ